MLRRKLEEEAIEGDLRRKRAKGQASMVGHINVFHWRTKQREKMSARVGCCERAWSARATYNSKIINALSYFWFSFVFVHVTNAPPSLAFVGHTNSLKDLRHVKSLDAST